MSANNRPRPIVTNASAPYWEAAKEGRLELPRLSDGTWEPYPRPGAADDYEWAETSTRGTVFTFAVAQFSPYDDLVAPYVVGLVELEDGPRVMTNIVEVDPNDVTIGMPVEVTFLELDDFRLPVFKPAS